MSNWSNLLSQYDTFFVDLVGVVHDGMTVFPEAIQALNQIDSHKTLTFVSNNPRPSALSIKKLNDYGLVRDFTVVTSGDYARAQLKLDSESLYYHWGATHNTDILSGMAIKLTDNIHQANKVLLTAFIEEQEDPTQFDSLIDQIVTRQLPVFCANPDSYAFNGKNLRKCAGYFADQLKKQEATVTIWGKPEKPFFEFVEKKLPSFDKKTCLMIGDTLETDIQGAQQFGIDSLLVLTGISEWRRQLHNLSIDQLTQTIKPTYIYQNLGAASSV